MKVIVFGATGMVGQGVLRECLLDARVESVLTVGRTATGLHHRKLRELVPADIFDLEDSTGDLAGYDACFFCLGVSSAGMKEPEYRRLTFDLTLSVARTLAVVNPGMTFAYVSGQGTDSSGTGRTMWARVKGQTENALLDLPLDAYMFRPGFILPMHGVVSKTRLYRVGYLVATPLYPLLKRLVPGSVTTSEQMGRAMLRVAESGAPERVLGNREITRLGS